MAKSKPYYGNFTPNKLLKARQNYDDIHTAPDNTIKNLDGNHVVEHKRKQWFENDKHNRWIDNTCNELEKLL